MQTTILTISGMMCQACVGHVNKALRAVAGVSDAVVDLASGKATVSHESGDPQEMVRAVEEEGYRAAIAE